MGGYAVAIGALFSTFGCLNGWILLQGQIRWPRRDGLFPSVRPAFGRQHAGLRPRRFQRARHDTNGAQLQRAAGRCIQLLHPSGDHDDAVPYVFTTMAELMLFLTDRSRFEGPRLGGSTVIALLAFAYSLWALYGAGAEVVLWGTLLLLADCRSMSGCAGVSPIAHGAAE
jgi:APA family basic amino acid/polyamine antiporter